MSYPDPQDSNKLLITVFLVLFVCFFLATGLALDLVPGPTY